MESWLAIGCFKPKKSTGGMTMNHSSEGKERTMSLVCSNQTSSKPYSQITIRFDAKRNAAWCYMHASPCPCFSKALLRDLLHWCDELRSTSGDEGGPNIRYAVLASSIPGVFNLGGDLALFRQLILTRNRKALLSYAKDCIRALYANISHFNRRITTISLVQGDALGGGFETAISSDVLIAERSASMGLPEIMFNLFPGMGAYSLLSRKIGGALAERMILSGRIYTAGELFEMGVVDILADDGEGEKAVDEYIRREEKHANGYQALREAKRCCNPVTFDELMNIVSIWADAALRLRPRDLHLMERLIMKQARKVPDAA